MIWKATIVLFHCILRKQRCFKSNDVGSQLALKKILRLKKLKRKKLRNPSVCWRFPESHHALRDRCTKRQLHFKFVDFFVRFFLNSQLMVVFSVPDPTLGLDEDGAEWKKERLVVWEPSSVNWVSFNLKCCRWMKSLNCSQVAGMFSNIGQQLFDSKICEGMTNMRWTMNKSCG